MASIGNRKPKSSYKELLKLDREDNVGLTSTLVPVSAGDGTVSPLSLASNAVAFHGSEWPATGETAGRFLRVSTTAGKLEWAEVATTQPINSYFPGTISPMVGTARWYAGKILTIKSVFLSISTSPSQDLVIDVKKNGISVFGSGTKPTIVTGANISSVMSLNISMIATDFLTIDIVSGNGSDLAVRFEYQ